MTALTSQVICKNPSVALYEICKNFSKISRAPLIHGHFHSATNLQGAAVTIYSENFGCPSQESLHKFKEHLFLMSAFKVYLMCREHGEGSSKFGGVDGASINARGCMVGGTP